MKNNQLPFQNTFNDLSAKEQLKHQNAITTILKPRLQPIIPFDKKTIINY